MTKPTQASYLILAGTLGLSLASWAFAAKAHTTQHNRHNENLTHTRRLQNSPAPARASATEPQHDLVVVQAPEVRSGPLAHRFPRGSSLIGIDPSTHASRNLTPGYFAAADPRISFDGVRVLFAGKKNADAPWQIWEMNADGSAARQITHCSSDCLKPAYLPRGEIIYTSFNAVDREQHALRSHVPREKSAGRTRPPAEATSQLWVCKADGSDAHPVTFGPGDFQVETVLSNGMVLATARFPLLPSKGAPADRQLYILRPDGTGLATLRCDHQHPAIRSDAVELGDGAVVFVKAPLASRSVGGLLTWIPRGALHNSPLAMPSLLVSSPQPLAGNQLVVARESATGARSNSHLALYRFDAETGRLGAQLYSDPALSAAEAVPVTNHNPPRWYWSTLNPALHRGYFICLDSYRAEGAPHGRIAATLARLRVLTLDAAYQRERVLGEAPIETDGSFYIAVPPDTPVRFEVLDAAGHVIRAQRSWIWTRSGEDHGCVGCHEDRALAPENRWPLALRRFDTPTRLDLAARPVSAH